MALQQDWIISLKGFCADSVAVHSIVNFSSGRRKNLKRYRFIALARAEPHTKEIKKDSK
jgi:hypothetical protein|nr:MAG TPA: hypothetical protein [Caudoviricetes sp.]